DAYAAGVAPRLTGRLPDRVAALAEYLFDEEGFTGDAAAYYDPRNSYLNDVLDRKLGIPLTLSLVAMAVGERAGWPGAGVRLPGPTGGGEGGGRRRRDPRRPGPRRRRARPRRLRRVGRSGDRQAVRRDGRRT